MRGVTRTLARVFELSEVRGAHAHRFRHTLATALLESDRPETWVQNVPDNGLVGAGDGIRTRDINLGKVALYQLSYSRGRLYRHSRTSLLRSQFM